jgi:hypothetical protein
MIALAEEFAVNRSNLNGGCARLDSRGMLRNGHLNVEIVPCFLEIGRTRMPIDVPAHVLAEHRRGGDSDVVLTVATEEPRTICMTRTLTRQQQHETNCWLAEMQDFDRF